MTTYEIRHKLYVDMWAEQLRQQRQSGLTVRDWCKQNNIPESTFSSHNRAVRNAFLEKNDIEEILNNKPVTNPDSVPQLNLTQVHLDAESSNIVEAKPDIHIEVRGIKVDINNSADFEHIGYIMGVIINVK